MKNSLYKQAYLLALSELSGRRLSKTAADGKSLNLIHHGLEGGKLYLMWKFLPALLAATALGAGGGYVMNRLSRHADPSIADSGTKDDIDRVERLKRIQYYNTLARQIGSSDNKNKED